MFLYRFLYREPALKIIIRIALSNGFQMVLEKFKN